MRAFGNLLIFVGLVAGLALTAFLFQWDSVQRAAAVTPSPAPVAAGAATAGVAPGSVTAISNEKPGEGVIQSGKAVYDKFCNGCHPNGRAGVGPALIGLSEETVKAPVRQGKGGMPAFGAAQISDAQMTELLAYLKSLK